MIVERKDEPERKVGQFPKWKDGKVIDELGVEVMHPCDKFIAFLDESLERIDAIDKETAWSESEPEWWLQMMTLRRTAQELRNVYPKEGSDENSTQE